VLPLKLHVDQDALDFLKRFFSFSSPPLPADLPVSKKALSTEPFFRELASIRDTDHELKFRTRRDLSCRAQAGL
jgi:autophagy-related protein 2